MPRSKEKVQKLLEKSKEIFYDCLLPNDCLVAAPSQMPYYPAQAKSYLYAWPGRDTGFSLTGALLLGIDEYERVLGWLWERAESFRKAENPEEKFREGLIFKSYHPDGRMFEPEFQPDQTGTLLWAIGEYARAHKLKPLFRQILEKSANGLAGVWKKDHFVLHTEGMWEEHQTHPRYKTNLAYSLAACAKGLEAAAKILKKKSWHKTAQEMEHLLKTEAFDKERGYFLRRFGGKTAPDITVDSSTLGLVWPFEVFKPNDKRVLADLSSIEKNLTDERGVYRYQFDEYEGEIEGGEKTIRQRAGAWPLLTFWIAIVQNKAGKHKKAEDYFWRVLDQVGDDLLIPEQLFPRGSPFVGVKPLLWSHMMFVHAAHELGFLKQQN